MTNEEINREIEIADIALHMINSFKNPIWLQDDSKSVIKKALTEYIDKLKSDKVIAQLEEDI